MKMRVSFNIERAEVRRGQSASCRRPVRTRCWSTCPSEDSMRIVNCSAGISMLNTATESF